MRVLRVLPLLLICCRGTAAVRSQPHARQQHVRTRIREVVESGKVFGAEIASPGTRSSGT